MVATAAVKGDVGMPGREAHGELWDLGPVTPKGSSYEGVEVSPD